MEMGFATDSTAARIIEIAGEFTTGSAAFVGREIYATSLDLR